MKFLIVRLTAIGDVLHALPLAAALKKRFPSAEVHWLVEPKAAPVVRLCRYVDRLWVADTQEVRRLGTIVKGLGRLREMVRLLRAERFNVAFDAQGLIKSGLLTGLSGASRRIGFDWAGVRETPNLWFTTEKVAYPEGESVILKNLALLRPLGIGAPEVDFGLVIPEEARRAVAPFLAREEFQERPLLLINPGAAWATKVLPPEVYARLITLLREEGKHTPALLWGPADKPLVEAIQRQLSTPALEAPPTSLPELLALAEGAVGLVGPDTGPLHLAAAVGTPCVAWFGPTAPQRNGPWGTQHHSLYGAVPCSPCHLRTCPVGLICHQAITAEALLNGIMVNGKQ